MELIEQLPNLTWPQVAFVAIIAIAIVLILIGWPEWPSRSGKE